MGSPGTVLRWHIKILLIRLHGALSAVCSEFLCYVSEGVLSQRCFSFFVFSWDHFKCACTLCLVNQFIDLPDSALKVRVFARPEALQYLYLRHSLLEVSPKRWICLEPVLLVFWPCLKYAIKSCIRTSILNLYFNNSVDWLKQGLQRKLSGDWEAWTHQWCENV